jgi:hypothetical protein
MNHAKTFAAIDKLKEVESELHRLKNALELANRALEAEREACAQMVDHILKEGGGTYGDAIRARGKE